MVFLPTDSLVYLSLYCQVLRNIVSNAIKFSPEGGKVTIRAFFDKTPDNTSESKDIETGDWPPSKTIGKTRANIGRSFLGNARSSYKVFATSSVELSQTLQTSQHKRLKDSHHSEDDFSCDAFAEEDRRMSVLSVGSVSLTGDTSLSVAAAAASLSGYRNNGNLIIIVTDSGPGISEANQKKLFRSVVQFDPEKNQGGGGSGFGLFISKGIVDLHNGTIAVRSEGEGHGCSFILTMSMVCALVDPAGDDDARTTPLGPLQLDLSVKSSASSDKNRRISLFRRGSIAAMMDWAEQRLTSTRGLLPGSAEGVAHLNGRAEGVVPLSSRETPRKKYRLLIVDDSGLSRKMLCKAMRAAGHECEEAGDGLIALNKVKEKLTGSSGGSCMYDAILIDRNMPVMDGPSAVKAIRDLGVTIPIFGVTGDGEDKDIDYFKSHGATAVLVKPMDMNEFLRYMLQLT